MRRIKWKMLQIQLDMKIQHRNTKKNFEKNEVNTPIQDSDEKFSHLNEMFCKLRKILKIIKQKAWKLKSP